MYRIKDGNPKEGSTRASFCELVSGALGIVFCYHLFFPVITDGEKILFHLLTCLQTMNCDMWQPCP